MKRLLIAALLVASLGSSAFALDVNKVSFKVQTTFSENFKGATNVVWRITENYTQAKFTIADEQLEAYFSEEGEMFGFSRKVEFKVLPINAIQKIKQKYSDYSVTEAIEFTNDGEKGYYVALEKGNSKKILSVSIYGEVSLFKVLAK